MTSSYKDNLTSTEQAQPLDLTESFPQEFAAALQEIEGLRGPLSVRSRLLQLPAEFEFQPRRTLWKLPAAILVPACLVLALFLTVPEITKIMPSSFSFGSTAQISGADLTISIGNFEFYGENLENEEALDSDFSTI